MSLTSEVQSRQWPGHGSVGHMGGGSVHVDP